MNAVWLRGAGKRREKETERARGRERERENAVAQRRCSLVTVFTQYVSHASSVASR